MKTEPIFPTGTPIEVIRMCIMALAEVERDAKASNVVPLRRPAR